MATALIRRIRFARALRSRRFALLWGGQTISAVGDGAFYTALAWQVLTLTGSGAAMGFALVAESLPLVLFMLVGGVVADRLPRRLTMLWSDGGRAVVTVIAAALGFSHHLAYWHLLALAAAFGLAEAFFRPAYQSIPPELVPVEDLPSANALTSFSRSVSTLVGPAIGAAVVSVTLPSGAFVFDALTFLISAICLLLMGRVDVPRQPRVAETGAAVGGLTLTSAGLLPGAQMAAPMLEGPSAPPRRGLRGVLADIREGVSYVTGSSWLWVTIVMASLGNVAFAPLQVALPRLVRDTYHQSVWLLGATLTAVSIGSILATLVVGQFKRIRRRGIVGYTALVVSSLGLAAFGAPAWLPNAPAILLVSGAALGAGLGVFEIIWATTMQELVPADKLGRVSSVDWLGSLSLQPIGLAVVGVLTDAVGPVWVFIVGGLVSALLVLLGLGARGVRELD
jgi:DHA3 family tetracycline resistance protein-like MFS transporter